MLDKCIVQGVDEFSEAIGLDDKFHIDLIVVGCVAVSPTGNNNNNKFICIVLGSWVVSMLDSGAEWPGFKSQSQRCRVTVLAKLVTPIVPLFTKQQNW